MRIKSFLKLIVILTSTFIFYNCEKSIFDYRHKYVGEWKFTTIQTDFHIDDTVGVYKIDTVYYNGSINYGEEREDLYIHYTKDRSLNLSVDKNGKLYNSSINYGEGEFESKEKVCIRIKTGGLGAWTKYDITGKKQ